MNENSIVNDSVWLDDRQMPMHCHGGSVLFDHGKYYFYGENKEATKPGSGIWHKGLNCYSSENLTDWKFENNILKPSDDEKNPLHPSRILDRPHILYNEKNKEYVMWMKLVGTDENPRDWNYQYMGIAVSDSITGDFTLTDTLIPLGMSSGDFDLFKDDDGRAYLVFGKVHTEIIIADLTDDYKNLTGNYTSHLHFAGPPIAREAPAVFKKDKTYYMLTSGTTGYYPNPTIGAKADSIHGPWYITGITCAKDAAQNSFNAQYSSVFHDPKSGQYIAVGDRWVPDLSLPIQKSSWNIDTSQAQYVWLPVEMDKDNPVLHWQKNWTPEAAK